MVMAMPPVLLMCLLSDEGPPGCGPEAVWESVGQSPFVCLLIDLLEAGQSNLVERRAVLVPHVEGPLADDEAGCRLVAVGVEILADHEDLLILLRCEAGRNKGLIRVGQHGRGDFLGEVAGDQSFRLACDQAGEVAARYEADLAEGGHEAPLIVGDVLVHLRVAVLVEVEGLAFDAVAEEEGAFRRVEVVYPAACRLGIAACVAEGEGEGCRLDTCLGAGPEDLSVIGAAGRTFDREKNGHLVLDVDEDVGVGHVEDSEEGVGQVGPPGRQIPLVEVGPEQTFLIQLVEEHEVFLEGLVLQPEVDLTVLDVYRLCEHVVQAVGAAEGLEDGTDLPEAERNLVGLAVAVGVLGLEGPEDFDELVDVGRHLKSEGLEPVLVDPLLEVDLSRIRDVDLRQGVDVAVGRGYSLLDARVGLHEGLEVGHVLVDQVVQRHQLSALDAVAGELILREDGAQEDVWQVVGGEKEVLVLLLALIGDFLIVHMDAGHLLIFLEDEDLVPVSLVGVPDAEDRHRERFVDDRESCRIDRNLGL